MMTGTETGKRQHSFGAPAVGAEGDELSDRRTSVLLVEDDPDTSQMLKFWLEANDYEVATAGSGPEAVDSALKGEYDAILLDLSLPVLDGIAALNLIRRHDELRDVPVVAITAYDAAYPRAEAIAAECAEYLIKPIDLDRLGRVLDRVIGH